MYFLLDAGATLSFVTPFISRKFDILPDILNEAFTVTNLVGECGCIEGIKKLSYNVTQ